MSQRRVVITGLGQVSPVGNDVATAWSNLLAGKSGIGRITRFDASDINSQIAGEVRDFDIGQYISAKEAAASDGVHPLRHRRRAASHQRCRFGRIVCARQHLPHRMAAARWGIHASGRHYHYIDVHR